MTDPFSAAVTAVQAAQAEGARLNATVTGLQTSLAAAAAQHAADLAKIAELEAELHPVPATVFGLDYPTYTASQRQIFGPKIPHGRVFTTGKPLTAAQVLGHGVTVADHPVNSFKKWDPAAFKAQLDDIPAEADEWWVGYMHEPEDNAKRSGNPARFIAGYLDVYAQMDAARKAHPNGAKVKLVKIMMRYQEVNAFQAGVTYKEFHGGQMFVDAFGWDCYDPARSGYMTAEQLLGGLVACCKELGLPACAPELGIALHGTDTAGRDAALAAAVAYAKANGLLWVNYWDQAQWLLSLSPAGVQTWKAAMA